MVFGRQLSSLASCALSLRRNRRVEFEICGNQRDDSTRQFTAIVGHANMGRWQLWKLIMCWRFDQITIRKRQWERRNSKISPKRR